MILSPIPAENERDDIDTANVDHSSQIGTEGGDAEGEAQTVNEATRLAYVVDVIDQDTHVIPKGALMQQPQGQVYHNQTFGGKFPPSRSRVAPHL